jgi:hypothetical protein
MWTVQASARLLHMPPTCCCCASSVGTRKFVAASTRTKGKRVIRTDTRQWSFPICESCMRWIRAHHAANRSRSFMVGLSIAVVVCVLIIFSAGSQNNFGVAFLAGVASVAAAGGMVFAYSAWKHNEKVATSIRPRSNCHPEPVRYVGWHGTVHTFVFSNNSFANAFATANHRKLVR